MSYLFAAIVMVLGVLAILAAKSYARIRARAAMEYKQATAEFFAATKPLVEDSETLDEIIGIISRLNATIQDTSMAGRLASFPLHRKWSDHAQRTFKVAEEFLASRPELEESFYKMFASWFGAVTALTPIAGFAARLSLSNRESIQSAAAKTSSKVADRNHKDNGTPHGIAHAH